MQMRRANHTATLLADEWKADLIVMGSHGRTGIALAFLGSTAESVVRHSRIPVLTVRGRG